MGAHFAFVIILCIVSQPVWAGLFEDFGCYSRSEVCRLKEVELDSERAIQTATFRDIRDPLVIESGTIPKFSDELYKKLPSITDLTIDRLGIVQLFVRPNLLHLSAVGNAIENVVLDTEASVFSMLTLHLAHNKLTSLPPLDRFGRLMTLVVDNNLLTSIDMGAFVQLANLRVLSMAHNLLMTVTSPAEAPIPLIKLRRLSFAGNQLAMLDIRTWEMDSLEVFNVTSNSLTRIEGSFTRLPVLRRLDLARNRWYCEWLMMLYTEQESASGFKLDSDEPDRCREENMMTSQHHCCNPAGADGSGLVDVFGDKWDELKRLAQLLDTLNATVASGSASVNRVLDTQNTTLSTQVAKLSKTQQDQTAQLKELEQGIDRLKDRLSSLQTDLKEKVDRLSQEVNDRWNHQPNADSGELLNGTKTAMAPTNWPVLASENEKNLSRLRELLVTTSKQFNSYASQTYQQEALVKSQVEKISTVQQELEKERLNGKQMKQQLDSLVPTVDFIFKFLQDVRDGCVEKFD